jgi:hypothetical protein
LFFNTDTQLEGIEIMPVEMINDGEPPGGRRDVHGMDDFQVVAERRRVMAALAALTDQYRQLNAELSRRETLRWMVAR